MFTVGCSEQGRLVLAGVRAVAFGHSPAVVHVEGVYNDETHVPQQNASANALLPTGRRMCPPILQKIIHVKKLNPDTDLKVYAVVRMDPPAPHIHLSWVTAMTYLSPTSVQVPSVADVADAANVACQYFGRPGVESAWWRKTTY
ncbi:hypothetical protein DFH06DRAFT_1146176 [Mycena polygramma]|nr:hypothetical protein DFH06DRAFT_1146176 [Mycena polygramma]